MRIAIDLDGVLGDWNNSWIRAYKARYGERINYSDITDWDFLHLTRFRNWKEFWYFYRKETSYLAVTPDTHGLQVMDVLKQIGHDLAIVTSRPEWAMEDTLSWIAYHRVPVTEVMLREDKHNVDADLFLDDGPHFLEAIKAAGKHGVRFVRPWNRPIEGVPDVRDWGEFLELVVGMEP